MDTINVELVYALAEEQTLLKFSIAKGTTLLDAIMASGILEKHPEINLTQNPVGIYSKQIIEPQSYILQPNDRIEIYRTLIADPKESRRLRAKKIQQGSKS